MNVRRLYYYNEESSDKYKWKALINKDGDYNKISTIYNYFGGKERFENFFDIDKKNSKLIRRKSKKEKAINKAKDDLPTTSEINKTSDTELIDRLIKSVKSN